MMKCYSHFEELDTGIYIQHTQLGQVKLIMYILLQKYVTKCMQRVQVDVKRINELAN